MDSQTERALRAQVDDMVLGPRRDALKAVLDNMVRATERCELLNSALEAAREAEEKLEEAAQEATEELEAAELTAEEAMEDEEARFAEEAKERHLMSGGMNRAACGAVDVTVTTHHEIKRGGITCGACLIAYGSAMRARREAGGMMP